MDGVIVDHSATVVEYLASKDIVITGREAIFSNLPKLLNHDMLNDLFNSMYESHEGTLKSELMPGVIEALDHFQRQGCKMYLLSRRNDKIIPQAMLERLGLWPKYFDETNTFFVERSYRKPEIAAELGITHYIDDQPAALLGIMNFIPNKFLFDQYNCMPDNKAYKKISTWQKAKFE